jgi:hypothetical protein
MTEEWKTHPDYTDYAVSTLGGVRRLTASRGTRAGRLLKPSMTSVGYPCVHIGGQLRLIHSLVLETFSGPANGREARHLNSVKADNRLSNLAWGTHAENYADRIVEGKGNHGSRHGMAKLSERDVAEIRRSYRSGEMNQPELSRRFMVSDGLICLIVNDQRWRRVS